ncbi:hypothetical protein B0H10DRAFT_2196942 [Mycena sp. CBHHK59/15]|nr:hypothetical protein B0H10DRAFT_2196942 [Mycena sp. CBHHK59/15]
MAASKHTPADRDFLDGLSGRQLTEFRNYMYTPAYITSNAGRFLDQEWIDVPTLKQFLGRNVSDAGHVASSTRSFAPSDSVCIKIEAPEPQSVVIPRKTATSVKIRTSYEGSREVLELSSDSEAHVADDSDIEVSEELTRAVSRSSSVFPPPAVIEVEHSDGESRTSERAVSRASSIFSPSEDIDVDHSDGESHASEPLASAEVIGMWFHKALALAHGDSEDSDDELVESDTMWQDPITSYVRTGNFDITQKIKNVKCIEYVSELPSIYPMYRDQTVIVVDLSDPKFNIEDPKTARKTSSGSGKGANPSNPVIIEAPEPAGPAPSAFNSFELGWDSMFPAAVPAFTSVDGMRSQAFTMSEANFIEPATADFLNPELYSAALTIYPDTVAPPPKLDLPYDLIAADLNSFFGFDSGFSSDIPSTAPADIAYANSSESPLAETFFDTAFNFYSTSSFASPLPSLPPPPAESPCGSSPAPENLTPDMPPSHLTRARRSRLDGLEPTNILAPGSSRSRAPSSRKRDVEENISEQPKKKPRAGKA